MTLLSKTLQTLLYKYLSDVDVEGVALPSLYNADGHSGWGVRLSNVKLREGVKLMDLPGRVPKENSEDGATDCAEEGEGASEQGAQQNTHPSDYETPRKTGSDSLPSTAHSVGMGSSLNQHSPMTGTQNNNNGPEIVLDDDDDNDKYYGGNHSEESSYREPSGRPPAPKRSSSWFTWGQKSKCDGAPSTAAPQATGSRVKSPRSGVGDIVSPLQALSVTEHVSSEPPRSGNSDVRLASLDEMDHSFHSSKSFGEHYNHGASPHRPRRSKTRTSSKSEKEPPMRLRLGKNGKIGILDVRLVGKDLHVVVEDADLTIEAVVVKPSSNHEKDENGKEKAPKVKPAKKIPDPQTIGDRILAENKLAKLFSIIPNLFLRDIRVKFIIREEPVSEPDKPTDQESPNDTVVELCIELLSVTDGEDFFAHVRGDEDEASTDGARDFQEDEATLTVAPTINPDGQFTQNEYLTKRIRTGRGPEGGIVMKIHPGEKYIDSHVKHLQWARRTWYSSADWCVLRCSGLDIHARIFMGTMKELQLFSTAETWYGDTDFDEYTVDSMLFGGVDYIAPGPQPPLPPMPENSPLGGEEEEGQLWTLPGATTYRIDVNGIQSSFVNTSFHRVARRMRPKTCTRDHLPCEYCDYCWDTPPGVPLQHSYDLAAPLGGLVLNIMIRDPLELNVDRPTLQIFGLLLQLFKKPAMPAAATGDGNQTMSGKVDSEEMEDYQPQPLQRSVSLLSKSSQVSLDSHTSTQGDGRRQKLQRSRSYTGRIVETSEDEHSEAPVPEEPDFGDISSAFPSYMSPEKVQYAGIYVGKILFRVHLMKTDTMTERGYGFCFWQLQAKCVTIDQHALSGDVTPFSDVRFDCGFLTVTSFKGNEQRLLVSLGSRQRVVEFDEATVETLMTRGEDCQRPPWPTTATVLLDIPPPLESLVFEKRERHAFQLRFISLRDPKKDKARSSAHLKLGSATINMPYASIREVSNVVREARFTIHPQSKHSENPERAQQPTETSTMDERLMKYRLQLDGARVYLEPLIDTRLPMCTLRGERSSLEGLSFETVLEKIQLRYGRQYVPTIMEEQRLSLERLARLPEQLRMRILLCLNDLNPLACALGMKSEENSFLRCRSINKRIVRVANKKKKRPSLRLDEQITRRQFLMQELVKLDDDELEDLYESHMRRMKRYARNQGMS